MSELAYRNNLNELKFRLIKQCEDQEKSDLAKRILIGKTLLEMRERVEAGEAGAITWWDWYEGNIRVRSRRDAERLMEIARQKNPTVAYEGAKAKDAAAHRERRAALATDVCRKSSQPHHLTLVEPSKAPQEALPIDEDLIDAALEAWRPLNLSEWRRAEARLEALYQEKFVRRAKINS
jgi:hypothetical protein